MHLARWLGVAGLWAVAGLGAAQAARVLQASPEGEVAVVRQVLLRFDTAVVAGGDPRAPAPFELRCNGRGPEGSARWLDDRRWVFDLARPLAAGQRCVLEARAGWQPLAGALEGRTRFEFSTGAPAVLQATPWPGSAIDEAQTFVLRLNGAVDLASVRRHAACEVEGLGERLGVRVVEGAERSAVLRALGHEAPEAPVGRSPGTPQAGAARAPAEPWLLLACQRPLPPGARVRLVWAAGIAAADNPGLVIRREQRFEWKVRPPFLAEFSCERENAQADCLPLAPMTLSFSAPLPRAQAAAIRLRPEGGGEPRAPVLDEGEMLGAVAWPAPHAPSARWRIELPQVLADDAGRPLANARAFPLAVGTAPLPPLARFAAAPLAVVEAPAAGDTGPATLAITLRQVQREWAAGGSGQAGGATPAQARGQLRRLHLPPATDDATLLAWIGRLQRDHARQWTTRALPMLAREAGAVRVPLPLQGAEAAASAPAAAAAERDPTLVLGVPLPARGLHVLEAESTLLGAALLGPGQPMHARTLALVTQLGVHFKRGRSSSLVWVTTLDGARPVRGARVQVNDCRGRPLWQGRTNGDGLAHIDRGFDDDQGFEADEAPADEGGRADPGEPAEADGAAEPAETRPAATPPRPPGCTTRDGLFVTARATLAGHDELGFVFSRWQRGIEPWRFGIAVSDGTVPDRRAHTVFSRNLLRRGERLHMKHFVRVETAQGLAPLPPAERPDAVWITHLASDSTTQLPLPPEAWGAGGRSAESELLLPANAALGSYEVTLVRGPDAEGRLLRLPAGSFRVEAFRVPLVDARLTAPGAQAVAPRELAFEARLMALAGGPLAAQPLRLDAVIEPASLRFAGFEDYSFDPPRALGAEGLAGDEPGGGNAPQIVARELGASTDREGRARFAVAALPVLQRPSELQAELSFADLNGETQTVSRRLRLWPAAVVAGLKLPQWASVRGPLQLEALALDTAGRPRPGQALVVTARQHRVLSTRTRVVGGFYAYDNRRELRELGEVCRGVADRRGQLACTVNPAQLQGASGEVEFIAEARDGAGRASRAAASAWIAGTEATWFAQDDDDRIELVPERRELEPGQRVRVQVRMPFARATALVTVEREGIVSARIVELSARDPVFEVAVPPASAADAAAWSPNIVVSALLLRGRVRERPWWSFFDGGWRDPRAWWREFRDPGTWQPPTALVDLAKPSFRLGATELQVGRAAQRLDVAVMPGQPRDGRRYQVRETVPVTVRVARNGLGVRNAEIAFVAVDEGLLALSPNPSWQLLEGLLAPRPWGVSTATVQGEIVGRRHHGRKALPAGGGGGANPTRELFDTLLLWRGRVQPDASGLARIELPLNDSLTRFRLVAIADDGQGRFGTGEASIEVGQDLELSSALPAVVREGDQFDAVLTLRNTTRKPMQLALELSGTADAGADADTGAVAGARQRAVPLEPAGPRALLLAPGEQQALRWRARVPEGVGRIRWTAQAVPEGAGGRVQGSVQGLVQGLVQGREGPAADRISVTQGVLPRVPQQVWQATLQPLGPEPLEWPMARPAGALPGSWQWQARLAPSLAVSLPAVQAWFRREKPFGLEERVSQAVALGDREALAVLGGELAAHLDSDGLAHFFPPPPGSPARGSDRLTAQLLALVHEAGLAWPAPLEQRMLGGLAAFVEGRLERRPMAPRADLDERKLAALAALARHGRAAPRQLGSLAWTPAVWPSSALLDAWTVLARVPGAHERDRRLAEVQRLLRSRLLAGGSTLRFATEADDERWWLLESADANAARLVLAAAGTGPGRAAGDEAWRSELPQLMSGTLARQRQGAWRTSAANAWGALALQRFAATVEAGAVAGRSVLAVDGSEQTLEWSGSTASGSAPGSGSGSVPGSAAGPAPAAVLRPASPTATTATLRARHQGSGRPWLLLQTQAAVPLAAPVSAGYRLERHVEPVRQQRPGQWSAGDLMRVRFTVHAAQDLGWVVLSDALPPGGRVVGGGLGGESMLARAGEWRAGDAWPAFEERGDDRWRAVFEWLPQGRHTLAYTLRLDAAGQFGLPPARVEAMHAPENFAELPLAPLEVRP